MKRINTYLRQQALLEKLYSESLVIPGKVNDNTGVIESISDDVIDACEEAKIPYVLDNYITDSMCMDYDSASPCKYWDAIYETLIKSHNTDKLIQCLKNYFGDDFIRITNANEKNSDLKTPKLFWLVVETCPAAKQIRDYCKNRLYKKMEADALPQELTDMMNFFNYYFSSARHNAEGEYYEILCEPKYSEKATDIVYNEYDGVLYHVTTHENVERILKRGLQLRGDKNRYRYFEPRINFFLAHDDEIQDIAGLIARQKGYFDDYAILKIDLNYGEKNKYNSSSYSLDFYHDTAYNDDWAVYTYGVIHPRFITVYKDNANSVNTNNVNESKGQPIDDQWLSDERPVQTKDGRQVIVTHIDMKEVPNIIHGNVKIKDKLFEYEWYDDGMCKKALDQMGNPKKPDEADALVKAI